MSCSRRYSGDSLFPPPLLSFPLSLSLFSRPPVSALVVLCAPPPLAHLLLSISRISLFRPFPLFCVREFCERIFLSVFLFVYFSVIVCRHVCMFIPPDYIRLPSSFPQDVIRHLRRPLRRMLCGIFCVHCTGYYPPTPDSPYARWSDSRRYSAEFFFPFSFLPSISRYVVYRYLGIFDVLPAPRCPVRARPSLSCARPPRFVLCSRVPRAILPRFVLHSPPPLARFSFSPSLLLFSFTCSFFRLPCSFYT